MPQVDQKLHKSQQDEELFAPPTLLPNDVASLTLPFSCVICLFFFPQRYILYLLYDVANELGWNESSEDPHLKRQLF